jgi:transposase-like protein
LKRYFCKDCEKSFSIDHREKEKLLISHLKGMSIRALAHKTGRSIGSIARQLKQEMDALPHNNEITLQYCQKNRFWGVLLVDGKYVKVKGYEKKIPFIFGIDYETHDIPICSLVPSENYVALKDFFMRLRNTGYKLRGIVCDDNAAIAMALKEVYPDAFVQLCHIHFLENIRRMLGTRTDETYRPFLSELQGTIFSSKKRTKKRTKRDLFELYEKYPTHPKALMVFRYIDEHIDGLTNHLKIGGCPKTNNLIESYNKQLNGRLKTIQGFESFQSAQKWLSAWILYRRLKPFTDCRGKFKKLNGTSSLRKTLKTDLSLPDLF